MQKLYQEGRIVQTKPGSVPRLKRYLDEGKGVPLGSVWDDIGPVQGGAAERVGYPTQKPLKLLKRILEISARDGDIVLDAFSGCGTAIEAAENSGREWIGIDISPTACRVVANRIHKNCGISENERPWQIGSTKISAPFFAQFFRTSVNRSNKCSDWYPSFEEVRRDVAPGRSLLTAGCSGDQHCAVCHDYFLSAV